MRLSTISPDLSVPRASPAASNALLDAEQLGRYLGLGTARPSSARAAINMRIRRRHPMPPSIMLPGLSGRRWLESAVIDWLKTYEQSDDRVATDAIADQAAPAPTVQVPRGKRGRPTKAEEMTRRRAAATIFDSSPGIKRK